ncbi:hypothetical protein N7537_010837 [Penicillium hordei]|uniref:phospholipase A2 n=1 Tax=Penicillium hordei TaxID=40994 RepID=A0AAD6DM56_9EURO|nr:uncharacterized protein N7537_010837 [Penicillium hordei]KAJ5588159.1 hypothetical protein N7537_010837 [Penicillium hordei]
MDGKQLCLLSLDGGGVRGLSMLFILREIMLAVNHDSPGQLKPCEYFDMIGGTSTGGLVAIMLGRLGMTVDECIEVYLAMMDKIFVKKHSRISFRTWQMQERFDHEILEKAVKQLLVDRGLKEDALLVNPDAKCKVFVCSTTKETSLLRRLATYPSRGTGDLTSYTKIWEAARATSAASSFFEPVAIGPYGEKFLDGGTGANNPVSELWKEASDVWSEADLESQLRCLVSVGTGVPKPKAFGDYPHQIVNALIRMATDTQRIADAFHEEHASLDDQRRYFRFNVDRGLEEVGLQESSKKNVIAAATRSYLATQIVQSNLRICGELLKTRECLDTLYFDYKERQSRITELNENEEKGRIWLLDNISFQSWKKRDNLNDHHGVLWIEGHPGSGKSTVMKQLGNYLTNSNPGDDVIIQFYFNARSSDDLAKSATGLFRSLLHQLLLQTLPLPSTLYVLYKSKKEHSKNDSVHWSRAEVEQAFFNALKRPGLKPVTILIDALDECGDESEERSQSEQIDSVFHSFQSFISQAMNNKWKVNLCISCRHFPGIRFEKCYTVVTEKSNMRNIEAYIHQTLPLLETTHGGASERESLKRSIIEKASGVFLWVDLVICDLRPKILQQGQSFRSLMRSLDNVPNKLHLLFEQLISNINEPSERKASSNLFKWILFSQKPLNAGEIREALILSDIAPFDRSRRKLIGSWEAAKQQVVDNQRFEDYIRSISKGLVEIVDTQNLNDSSAVMDQYSKSDDESDSEESISYIQTAPVQSFWKRRVQVIHDSVRTFFLEGNGARLNSLEEWSLEPMLTPSYIGKCHEQLLRSCLNYLSLVAIHKSIELREDSALLGRATSITQSSACDEFSASSMDSDDLFEEPNLLLQYSARYIFEQARMADENGISQGSLAIQLLRFSDGSILRMLLSFNNQQPVRYTGGRLEAIPFHTIILALASFYNVTSCIQSLLAQPHVDKNHLVPCRGRFIDEQLCTPLMIACQTGHDNVVKELLRAKVDVNIKSKPKGRTALHYAAQMDYKSIVKRLVRYGAEIQALDDDGFSPLHSACSNFGGDVMTYLLRKSPVIQRREEQNGILSALLERISSGDQEALEFFSKLLKDIPDINYQDSQGRTALGLAINTGNAHIVELVLRSGGSLWNGTDVYNNPLFNAVQRYSLVWVVRIMMNNDWDMKYDLNKTDIAHGKTILHWAAESGAVDLVDELLTAGVDFTLQDVYGETPLHYAAENDHIEIVQRLVQAGADVHATDFKRSNYRTPFDCANNNGYSLVARFLASCMGIEYGPNKTDVAYGKTKLHWAAESGAVDLVDELLTAGVDFTLQDVYGETPLHYAAENGHLEIVQRLVQAGADVHATDFECRDHRTPLDCATHNGHSSVAYFLASCMSMLLTSEE